MAAVSGTRDMSSWSDRVRTCVLCGPDSVLEAQQGCSLRLESPEARALCSLIDGRLIGPAFII